MKEYPLLFKAEMIRAILEQRKSQTRRMRSLQVINKNPDNFILTELLIDKPKKNLVLTANFTQTSFLEKSITV